MEEEQGGIWRFFFVENCLGEKSKAFFGFIIIIISTIL